MKVAFQKNPTSILDKLICWWTKSPYFHCVLNFSDGVSYSALPSTDTTQFYLIKFDENWDVVDIPMSAEQEANVRAFCQAELGCKYDFIGIFFSQIISWAVEDAARWFCSEVCLRALQQAELYIGVHPCQYSPGKLYQLVTTK